MMKMATEYEQLMGVILEDLRVCLRYTPNRENDLLCFIEQYQKASGDMRPDILGNLRACMDGKPYPNPYTAYQRYGEKEIKLLEQLLRGYLEDMQTAADKELVLTNLVAEINGLQDKCCGQLIDSWRKDHLTQLLVLAAKEAGCPSPISLVDSQSRW
jgi:hypothetical protein